MLKPGPGSSSFWLGLTLAIAAIAGLMSGRYGLAALLAAGAAAAFVLSRWRRRGRQPAWLRRLPSRENPWFWPKFVPPWGWAAYAFVGYGAIATWFVHASFHPPWAVAIIIGLAAGVASAIATYKVAVRQRQ
jgi:hypothetical protein